VLFCTTRFTVFLAVVFAVYWAMPWRRARVWWLLAASFYFYASWNHWLALIVCGTAFLDYLVARALDAWPRPGARRLLLGVSLTVNLGVLVYFKYANFFLQSVQASLHAAGMDASLPVLQVILPIGISFYTFEAINYVVDVYRGKMRAERDLGNFLLFILFFPHLVAGPIVRARDFLPQIARRKRWSWGRLHVGALLFLMGLFKKLAVADRMAQFADPVFADPGRYGSTAAWVALIAYALQVYCDFSGYTDMAIGTAHMLGYKLAPNFNMPYLSANIAEFWRRWHISLSTWLRDYLYIPLGGSRGRPWRTWCNLVIVMTAGGLWHGASWMYVSFGVLHGLMLAVHRIFRSSCERAPPLQRALATAPGTVLRVTFTFLCFCLTLAVFRSLDWGGALCLTGRLFLPVAGLGAPRPLVGFWGTLAAVAASHYVGRRDLAWKWLGRMPAPLAGVAYAAALTLTLVLAPASTKAFIYFQF
jgi:alginate O-acetyltransferase complex protein AlgI